MPRSKAQLSRVVLQKLIDAPDQEPEAANALDLEARYDSKLLEWRDDGLVYWPNGTNRNTEEIPDRVFSIVCDLMENEVRDTYKRDNPPVQRMAQEEIILSRLRRHLAKPPSGEQTWSSTY